MDFESSDCFAIGSMRLLVPSADMCPDIPVRSERFHPLGYCNRKLEGLAAANLWDVYGLGATLWRLIANRDPFAASAKIAVEGHKPEHWRFPAPDESTWTRLRVPGTLLNIARAALRSRKGSANDPKEMHDLLRDWMNGNRVAGMETLPAMTTRWARHNTLAAATASAVVVVSVSYAGVQQQIALTKSQEAEASERARANAEEQHGQAESQRADAEAKGKLAESRRADSEAKLRREETARANLEAKLKSEALRRVHETHVNAARNFARLGDWTGAAAAFDSAIGDDCDDAEVLSRARLDAFLPLKKLDELPAELEKHRTRFGREDAKALLIEADLGFCTWDAKKHKAARAALDKALTLPGAELTDTDRAYAEGLRAGSAAESEGHFREALRMQPFHHRANTALAGLLLATGRLSEARVRAELLVAAFGQVDPTGDVILVVADLMERRPHGAIVKRIDGRLPRTLGIAGAARWRTLAKAFEDSYAVAEQLRGEQFLASKLINVLLLVAHASFSAQHAQPLGIAAPIMEWMSGRWTDTLQVSAMAVDLSNRVESRWMSGSLEEAQGKNAKANPVEDAAIITELEAAAVKCVAFHGQYGDGVFLYYAAAFRVLQTPALMPLNGGFLPGNEKRASGLARDGADLLRKALKSPSAFAWYREESGVIAKTLDFAARVTEQAPRDESALRVSCLACMAALAGEEALPAGYRGHLAMQLAERASPTDARALLQLAARLLPDLPAPLRRQAEIEFRQWNVAEALRLHQKAATLDGSARPPINPMR